MKKYLLFAAIGGSLLVISMLFWFRFLSPQPISVGVVHWMQSGAIEVVGSSELNAATIFKEEQPRSRIRIVPVDDQWNPDIGLGTITPFMAQGIRFFVSSHPSNCAVALAKAHLYDDSAALFINVGSTSPALTGKDDYLLRVITDGEQEQRAIARFVRTLPGTRLLVLQDEGNLAYTDPAFAYFTAELSQDATWQIIQRKLTVADFQPQAFEPLMSEPFDALYILAGSFQSAIGNMAQLFHYHHPDAPIILTPWARSPAILEIAGDAAAWIVLPSHYPSRIDDPVVRGYFQKFQARFGYTPHAITIGVRQALELLDQAFQKGHVTPEAVKAYLLSTPVHQTSLGTIAFDQYGDVSQTFYFIRDVQKELQ